jgi:hypothetical protein
VLRSIKMVFNWFFKWGEHAKFATEIGKFLVEYFGLWKMFGSIEMGLLAAVARGQEASPFWFGAAGFAVTLVIINASWSLFNKWQNSKHVLAAASASQAAVGLVNGRPTIDNLRSSTGSVIPIGTFTVDKPDGWEKLYEEYDRANRKELRLRFLPDTNDQASDALLLICYGYKIIKKVESISAKICELTDRIFAAKCSKYTGITNISF